MNTAHGWACTYLNDHLNCTRLFSSLSTRSLRHPEPKTYPVAPHQEIHHARKSALPGQCHSHRRRDSRAVSSDGALDIKLTTPKELGGAGGNGTNPEQLFAAGYSACFMGAMKFVAGKEKIALPSELSINGIVGIGPIPTGFGIEVELRISAPAWTGPPCVRWSTRRTSCALTPTPRAATST